MDFKNHLLFIIGHLGNFTLAGAEAGNVPVESSGAELHRSPGVDQPSDPGGQQIKCWILRAVN